MTSLKTDWKTYDIFTSGAANDIASAINRNSEYIDTLKNNPLSRPTDINLSDAYPTAGTSGTNIYTLPNAIAVVPSQIRKQNLMISFLYQLNADTVIPVSYRFNSTDVSKWTTVGNWTKQPGSLPLNGIDSLTKPELCGDYSVTYMGKCVASLSVTSDFMGHVTNQFIKTNMAPNESGTFDGSHEDSKINAYMRIYNISGNISGIDKGKFGNWIRVATVQDLLNSAASAIKYFGGYLESCTVEASAHPGDIPPENVFYTQASAPPMSVQRFPSFVGKVGSKYYREFSNLNAYSESGINLDEGKLYIDLNNNLIYVADPNFMYGILKIGGSEISGDDFSQLSNKVENLNTDMGKKINQESTTDQAIIEETDSFKVVDRTGNVIAEINPDGFHTTSVNLYDKGVKGFEVNASCMNETKGVIDNIRMKLPTDVYQDILAVTDPAGNVIAEISAEGIKAVGFLDKKGNPLSHSALFSKKKLFTVGDSMSTRGLWQKRVCDLLGCTFDNAINTNPGRPISMGGTISSYANKQCGLSRVLNLKGTDPDLIILENVNDYQAVDPATLKIRGNITDEAFIISQFLSHNYKITDWGADLLKSVPAAERMSGTVVTLEGNTPGKNLSITQNPTKDGNVTLRTYTSDVGWNTYSYMVKATDTLDDILDKLLEYIYFGVIDTLADNGTSVDFSACYANQTIDLRFEDTGSTGMTVNITDTATAKKILNKVFTSRNVNDWETPDMWAGEDWVNFYRAWKGMIEFIQREFPAAKLYIAAFPRYTIGKTEFLRTDGTYDMDAYLASPYVTRMNVLYTELKKIAQMYNVPFLDVNQSMGISLNNLFSFFGENNPHPYESGYDRIGETIATLIN